VRSDPGRYKLCHDPEVASTISSILLLLVFVLANVAINYRETRTIESLIHTTYIIMVRLRHLALCAIAAVLPVSAHSHDEDPAQKPLTLSKNCHHPAYRSHILSKSPLVIYLTDFLTAEERQHLTEITCVHVI
jgi:hypothetical protein